MRPEIASRKQRQSQAVHLAVFRPNWQIRAQIQLMLAHGRSRVCFTFEMTAKSLKRGFERIRTVLSCTVLYRVGWWTDRSATMLINSIY